MLKQFLKKQNKGFSLIEVIVAMLILAIMSIPLLSALNMVSRINYGNREKQYAGNVGTSIMEAVKQFGLEETALQMNGKSTFKYADVSGGQGDSYGETGATFSSDTFLTSTSTPRWCIRPLSAKQFVLWSRTDTSSFDTDYIKKYYFVINGIEEGTKKYDVSIMFDATLPEYQSAENTLNNYSLADLTSLNSTRTALIAPSGVWFTTKMVNGTAESYDISKTFETEALRVFQERYSEYMNKQLAEEKSKWTATNELAKTAVGKYIIDKLNGQDFLENYFIAGNDAATERRRLAYDYYTTQYESEYRSYLISTGCYALDYRDGLKDINGIMAADPLHISSMNGSQRNETFIAFINRKSNITIGYEAGQYVVTSETVFTFDEGTNDYLCDHNDLTSDDPNKVAAALAQVTYECKGYYDNMKFDALSNIYLFQDGAKSADYKSDLVYIDASSITGKIKTYHDETNEISFYSVWQYMKTQGEQVIEDINPSYTGTVTIRLKSTQDVKDQFRFYVGEKPGYTLEWVPVGVGSDTPLIWKNTVISDLDKKERAYMVTVKVYESGAEKTDANVLYSLNTVIKE